MLFAISYDDSEVINNVSRQQPFQFIKQPVVIKYNIPSALVKSQESLSLTCDKRFQVFPRIPMFNGVIDCTNIYCGSSKDLNGK